jgi:tRNA-specific 2-thiouridylase
LARTLFPLGELTKSDTRDIARGSALKTADKEESMEICFVPDNDYGRFLRQAKLVAEHRGEIVDLEGRILGHHAGIEFFTIGQRKAVRFQPATFTLSNSTQANRVIVGMIRRWRGTNLRLIDVVGFHSQPPDCVEALTKTA